MNVSMNWLKKYIQPSLKIDEMAEKLTRIGTAVETIEYPNNHLEKVIAVEVKKAEKHPNADKLLVMEIWDGKASHQVVTGAKNAGVGDVLFWAPPETELPNGMKIEKTILREIDSFGMLCSASELNLDSKLESERSKDGLLIAHPNTQVGESYLSEMGFDSPLLEFEITANRADCFSMIGIAREISVLTNEALHIPDVQAHSDSSVTTADCISIEVEDSELCPRFVAQVMTDIQIQPSPLWLVQALQSIGLRSINNVVDVTNFVMMEMGQPLHAYDLDKLAGRKLVARCARADEIITTLDDKVRNLSTDMIVIADAEKPVGIAGIMGGLESEVTGKTTSIAIEAAVFNGPSIRKTGRALGLRSDASSRFERGVDQKAAHLAALRVAELLQEMGAGKIAQGYLDIEKKPTITPTISFSKEKINQFLGSDIAEENMVQILTLLGCEVQKNQNSWQVIPPSWRADIQIFEDLAEEIIRIYGYDKIVSTLPSSASQVVQLPKLSKVERAATDALAAIGFNQCVHFSFTSPEVVRKLQIPAESTLGKMIPVLNPIVDELSHMKTTLLGSLLETLQRNQSQKAADLKLFEVARVFLPQSLPLSGNLPTEELVLSAVATGTQASSHWGRKSQPVDFYYMKGIGETLLDKLGIHHVVFKQGIHPSLHPGRTAELTFNGATIGWVGEVHPLVQDNFDLPSSTLYLEVNLSKLSDRALPISNYRSFGRLPSVYRDLAFVIGNDVSHDKIITSIQNLNIDLLAHCELFDVYQGDNLPKGKKSLAYSFIFQNPEKTLEDKDIDPIVQKIIHEITEKYQAELRS